MISAISLVYNFIPKKHLSNRTREKLAHTERHHIVFVKINWGLVVFTRLLEDKLEYHRQEKDCED